MSSTLPPSADWHRNPNWEVDTKSATATVRDEDGRAIARCYRGDSDARDIAALPQAFNALHEVGDIIEAQLVNGEVTDEGWQLALNEILAVLKLTGDVEPTPAVNPNRTDAVQFTHLEVEAALCVWEHLLECCNPLSPRFDDNINTVWGHLGAFEFRHASMELGRYCLKVYDLIPEDVRAGHAYDWDIIPAILGTIDWATGYTPTLPAETAASMVIAELGDTI